MFCLLLCSPAARQWMRRHVGPVLLAVAIAFGLGVVSKGAWAGYPPQNFKTSQLSGTYYSTEGEACTAAALSVNSTYSGTPIDQSGPTRGCQYKNSAGTNASGTTLQLHCADGTISSTYTAATRDTFCATAPPADTCAAAVNSYRGASVTGSGSSIPDTVCIQGCGYSTGAGIGVVIGSTWDAQLGVGTGAACSGANYTSIDTTTKKTDPPSLVSCALQGMVFGTVNGVGVCAGAGTIPNSTVTQSSSTSTTNTSSGGTITTGATTTTYNVTNVNGVPMVTATTTNADGSKVSTTQDQPSFCQANPNAQVCKADSGNVSGGGDCTAPPACQGDAVQCAMVNQQWHTRCDSQQSNPQSALAVQVLGGNDPVQSPAASGNRTSVSLSSSLDQSPFLGGGGLSDKVFVVSGQSINFPFSKLNQYLSYIGYLFVAISMIGAARIVVGGFK